MDVKPALKADLGVTGITPRPAPVGKGLDSFGEALFDAVQTLSRLQQEADARSTALATGEPVELHDVMLTQERAALGLDLAVQVRNKFVEAYQEIMRMQI